MLTEHETTIEKILLTTTPDGSLGIVLVFPIMNRMVEFARADVSGAWMASLVDVLGRGTLAFGARVDYPCRARVDRANDLFELGRDATNYWFNVRPGPHPEDPSSRPAATEVARALAYLNNARALGGLLELDPIAEGYTDDAVVAEALLRGWKV